MKTTTTVQAWKSKLFKEQKLPIGLDLGDCWSFYCVLEEAGQIILEQNLPTTPEAMKQTFGKIPRSLIALKTGTYSPWVSRRMRTFRESPAADRVNGWASEPENHNSPKLNCFPAWQLSSTGRILWAISDGHTVTGSEIGAA